MDAIATGIRRVMHAIPNEILKMAFQPRRYDPTRTHKYSDQVIPESIEERIKQLVVTGRVALDVNLTSGTEVLLPLQLAEREVVDTWNTIYRFPPRVLAGRTIVQPYEVMYGQSTVLNGNYQFSNSLKSSTMLQAGRDMIRAAVGNGITSSANVSPLDGSSVLVNDVIQPGGYAVLRAQVSNEPNFNNIKPAYRQAFGELILLATKAYVYNQLVIEIDEGQLKAGASIGRFREKVDEYADADSLYMEYLTVKWPLLGFMNDDRKFKGVLRMATGRLT